MIEQSNTQNQKKLVLQMLNEFYGPSTLYPQVLKMNQSDPIHLNTVLLLFWSTGSFNPLLLRQVRYNFQERRQGNNQIYVTKEELVEELCGPKIQQSYKNSKIVFEILKNQNNKVDIGRLVKNQEHIRLSKSNKLKQSLDQIDIDKIINNKISNSLPRQNRH